MDTSIPPEIPLPQELLAQTPPQVLTFIGQILTENQTLRAENQTLRAENQALKEHVQALSARIERLEARLNLDSSNSNKPPSSDSPFKPKKEKPKASKPRKKRKGIRQQCLRPTEVIEQYPEPCTCGCASLGDEEPYYIHQVIEIPVVVPDVKHYILYRGHCSRCGKLNKAVVPPDQRSGFGPRLSAAIAELCGIHGDSRRAVQDFLRSFFDLPISQGGIQKVIDRASRALEPHYEAIEAVVFAAKVNHADETSWFREHDLKWLWVLTCALAAKFMIHDKRSAEAFNALIKDWMGILVSDGYGLYRKWVGQRQSCLAHLIRRAKGLAERGDKEIAKCGKWAQRELQRLCHMANAPPTVGEWNMFYARLIRLISKYRHRKDDAGRLVRHIERELEHLWVFLQEEGVAPTNNHAERMLRFAVLWRKRSLGTASEKGDRWVERILSLRQTCRLRGKRTYPVLVDAFASLFTEQKPDVGWIMAG